MDEHEYLPDVDRLSVVASTILLAYALIPFLQLAPRTITIQLGASIFVFPFTFSDLISVMVAAMAAFGAEWLLQTHPHVKGQSTWQHMILPAMTAWVIGIPLSNLEPGVSWWAVFGFGGLLLILVFLAEFIVLDLTDTRHVQAVVGLTAVSFALFLVVAIVVRTAEPRLYLQLPALVATLGVVALRTIYLRLGGRWSLAWSAVIAIFVGQLAVGLHYLPVSPLRFGLLLLGPAYALTNIAASVEEGRTWREYWVEPAVMLGLMWVLSILVG
jgi:hypothetical protein